MLPSHSAVMLGDVKSSLDKEAADLDRRRMNMSTGSKLLKEKERNLRQLETSLLVDKVHFSHAFVCIHVGFFVDKVHLFIDKVHSCKCVCRQDTHTACICDFIWGCL